MKSRVKSFDSVTVCFQSTEDCIVFAVNCTSLRSVGHPCNLPYYACTLPRLVSIMKYVLTQEVLVLQGQRLKHSLNIFLSCTLYCDAGPSYLFRTVCKSSVLLLSLITNVNATNQLITEDPSLMFSIVKAASDQTQPGSLRTRPRGR